MTKKKYVRWEPSEDQILYDNPAMPFKELVDLLPGRSESSLNTRWHRLKSLMSDEERDALPRRAKTTYVASDGVGKLMIDIYNEGAETNISASELSRKLESGTGIGTMWSIIPIVSKQPNRNTICRLKYIKYVADETGIDFGNAVLQWIGEEVNNV